MTRCVKVGATCVAFAGRTASRFAAASAINDSGGASKVGIELELIGGVWKRLSGLTMLDFKLRPVVDSCAVPPNVTARGVTTGPDRDVPYRSNGRQTERQRVPDQSTQPRCCVSPKQRHETSA